MFDELLMKALQGDKKAIEEIINRLQPLIISSIKRYYNNTKEYEDLIQDGNIMIIQSLKDYDESKGAHFLGYIKSNLKFLYLNKHRTKTFVSLNEPVGYDKEEEIIDLLVSEDKEVLDLIIDNERNVRLIKAIDNLTSRQKEVIIYYYVKEFSIDKIAELLGVSYRTIVNTKTRALDNLKNAFSKDNI